jgi:acetylornithine deacetylase
MIFNTMIDKDFTIKTLQKLVQINSVNPDLEDGGAGEEEIGRYIFALLEKMGIETEIDEIAPGRFNVTGVIKGEGTGPSLMLNAHMDTVGVKGMADPFSAKISDGKLFGRGAYDMKGSIAAILAAAKSIKEERISLKGDLVLSFVADEEYESIGAQALVKKIKTDTAIVAEPTNLNICTAHRGFGIWKINTKGKTAHGGNHHLGVDANMNMGLLLAELHKRSKVLPEKKKHPLCGEGSMHIPMISGGRSLFIYSDECAIRLERRTLPGEKKELIETDLLKIIKKLRDRHPGFEAEIESLIWRSPYEIDRSASIVKNLEKAIAGITGKHPKIIGHTWWEDSAIFGEAGIETVIFGPIGGGIHEDVEWVETDSVVKLAGIFRSILSEGSV